MRVRHPSSIIATVIARQNDRIPFIIAEVLEFGRREPDVSEVGEMIGQDLRFGQGYIPARCVVVPPSVLPRLGSPVGNHAANPYSIEEIDFAKPVDMSVLVPALNYVPAGGIEK